ncbi:MAG TPA: aldose epimerase family protein [Clostridia bacterium]|nr:aldose epimerase family protein [Clostridia bacterium]
MIKKDFGVTRGGEPVSLYRLENASGAYAEFLDYGATVRSLVVPNTCGKLADVVLGFDDIRGYEKNAAYIGAFIGRYCNRIGGARFTLMGKEYRVSENEPNRCLHGGIRGFDKRMYSMRQERGALVFTRLSPDGEEGFPGNLKVRVTYRLTDENALEIDYEAESDAPTVVNLTNHSYFNLNGAGDILRHALRLDADHIAEIDENFNITGSLLPVAGTPFDFRAEKQVGKDIEAEDEQLHRGSGYDHNFVLNGKGFRRAAVLTGDQSGIRMEVCTDAPGVQFYTANFLNGAPVGKNGQTYKNRSALCLETQNFPDAPNQKSFPSAVLLPGEVYRTRTAYRFY